MGLNLERRRLAFRRNADGYVLLTLLLMVTLLILAIGVIVPSISFEIRRDREEEMIHRGVQYSRAIRTYYKKFGRYPAKIEDLESTNNLRFLRKRYKDPVTGQDFKLLHYGEVKMTFSAPLAGVSNLNAPPGLNNNSGFGQAQPGGAFGGPGSFGSPAGSFGGPAGNLGGGPTGFGAAARPGSSPDAATNNDQNQPTDPSSASPSSSSSSSTAPQPGQGTDSGNGFSGPTFGGMPVVGVVSTSKKNGIREFNHKKKYSEWQFIYDPATDRGGLLMTPNQPPLQGFGNQQLQPGQPGTPGSGPFGSSPTGLGNNPSGLGNNPSGNNNNPNPPPTTNPQNPQ
jgi:type II secretory pathway pseudopilin PulG